MQMEDKINLKTQTNKIYKDVKVEIMSKAMCYKFSLDIGSIQHIQYLRLNDFFLQNISY